MGVPPSGGFIRENPIKMDDLGVPLFQETPICLVVESMIWIDMDRYGSIGQAQLRRADSGLELAQVSFQILRVSPME